MLLTFADAPTCATDLRCVRNLAANVGVGAMVLATMFWVRAWTLLVGFNSRMTYGLLLTESSSRRWEGLNFCILIGFRDKSLDETRLFVQGPCGQIASKPDCQQVTSKRWPANQPPVCTLLSWRATMALEKNLTAWLGRRSRLGRPGAVAGAAGVHRSLGFGLAPRCQTLLSHHPTSWYGFYIVSKQCPTILRKSPRQASPAADLSVSWKFMRSRKACEVVAAGCFLPSDMPGFMASH